MFSLVFGLLVATKNFDRYMCDDDIMASLSKRYKTLYPGKVYCVNPTFDIIIDGDPVDFKIYRNGELEKSGKGVYCISDSYSNTIISFTTETEQTVSLYTFPFATETNTIFLTNKPSFSGLNIVSNVDLNTIVGFLQVGDFANCKVTADLSQDSYANGVIFNKYSSGSTYIDFSTTKSIEYPDEYSLLWILAIKTASKSSKVKVSIDSERQESPWKHEIYGAVKYTPDTFYNYDEFVLPDSSEGLSTPALIGVSVGAIVLIIIIIVAIYFCACRKNKRVEMESEEESSLEQSQQQQKQQQNPPQKQQQGQHYKQPPQGQNYPPPPPGQYYPPPQGQYYPPPPPGQYYPPPQGQYYPPPQKQGQNYPPPPPGQYYPPPQGQYYPPHTQDRNITPQPQQDQSITPQPPSTDNAPQLLQDQNITPQPPQDQNITPQPPSTDNAPQPPQDQNITPQPPSTDNAPQTTDN